MAHYTISYIDTLYASTWQFQEFEPTRKMKSANAHGMMHGVRLIDVLILSQILILQPIGIRVLIVSIYLQINERGI